MNSKWSRSGGVAIAVLLLTLLIAAFEHHRSSQPKNTQTGQSSSQPFALSNRPDPLKITLIPQRFYPYSVIPGGVRSKEGLRTSLENDPVVARHYQGFDLATARIVALQRPLSAYVSYRVGDDVFWTRHKVYLPKGETVMSDGSRLARTRCGNRISETPQLPTSAKEPSSETLEAALEPAFVNSPEEPTTLAQSLVRPLPEAENFAETPVGPSVPPIWWVPLIPIEPVPPLPPQPPPITPPVNIPEPGTAALLIFGTLVIGVAGLTFSLIRDGHHTAPK